jgi:hypothetical protein
MNRSEIFSTEAWRASIFASASASLVGLRERLRVRLLFFAFFGDFFGDFFGECERLRERLRERLPERRRLFLGEPLEPFWKPLLEPLLDLEPVEPWSDSELEAAL